MLLGIPANVNVIFERYSDSAASYILLDEANPSVYKQLYRAAKAKSKLRIKATVVDPLTSAPSAISLTPSSNQSPSRHSYLETVLSSTAPMDQLDSLENTPELATTSVEVDAIPTQSTEVANSPRYRPFEEEDKALFPTISHSSPNGMFCIDCNHCGRSIANEHYHCSVCEFGDYDLCPKCIGEGASCRNDGHWLIKRTVVDGIVTNSTTERIPPRRPLPRELQDDNAGQEKQDLQPKVAICPAKPSTAPENVAEVKAASPAEQPVCNGCCRGKSISPSILDAVRTDMPDRCGGKQPRALQ